MVTLFRVSGQLLSREQSTYGMAACDDADSQLAHFTFCCDSIYKCVYHDNAA